MEQAAEKFSPMSNENMDDRMRGPGNFVGHFGPGVVCIIYGFIWTYNNLFQYHAARQEALRRGDASKLHYKSSLFSKYHDSSKYVLVEPYGAIIFGIVGFFMEIHGVVIQGHPVTLAIHHDLMYYLYAFMGVCAILRHRKYAVPPDAEYAVFLVANVAEGYLFLNHHLTELNRVVHKSISLLNFVTALCVAGEVTHRRSILAALGRTLSFMAAGIWFVIAGFVIYPPSFVPKWEAEEHVKMDIMAMLLVVVVASVLSIALVMNFIVSQRIKNLNMATVNCIIFSGDVKFSPISNSDNEKQSFLDSVNEY